VSLEGEEVTFTWRGYAQGQRIREMTLSDEEFLHRFLLHVPALPYDRRSQSPTGSPCSGISLA